MNLEYQIENNLSIEEFREILLCSTLGERRPLDSPERLEAMLRYGNLIITARSRGRLVGVSRSLTDFMFCTYLSDLAVHLDFQRQGIGRELIRRTKLETPQAKLILLAAPAAIHYYPKIGLSRHEHCYMLDDVNDLM